MPRISSIWFSINPATRRPMRSNAWEIFFRSSKTSGTTRFAASVGVEALRSAASSVKGLSFSCPIALTIGVLQFATARTTFSSEKTSKSWKLPPPRAKIMTSTSGSESSSSIALMISGAALSP